MLQKTIKTGSAEMTAVIFGTYDVNVRLIEREFSVGIHNREADDGYDNIIITGENEENVNRAARAVGYLADMARYNDNLSEQSVKYVVDMISDGRESEFSTLGDDLYLRYDEGQADKGKDRRSEAVCGRDKKEYNRTRSWVPPEPEKPSLPSLWRSRLCGTSRFRE